MDKLPEDLHVDILRRLDSADVARCRRASKIFNDAYPHLRSIKLHWTIVKPSSENLFRNLDNEFYNLVTNKHFIKEWLPKVSENLKSLSLTDFLEEPPILWQRSKVLKLVSIYCHKLVELKVKHTRLSVDSLSPMLMLTSLTLESLYLYDEHVTELNMCTPNLQVLNLVSVYGLADPKIHLLNLKSGQLTSPIRLESLSLIAPKLIRLRLKGTPASKLYVEAPIFFDPTLDSKLLVD
ncbi:F-box/LRR-repeat protein-like protein [Tanacetum coccineum]